ncbi:MAG: hypothetical protein HYS36_00880 [Candidatus Rokubacteria bacterium]|nr:hypothetical protein [Candidatus Rokubacteria bacterium]MBI2526027.1 hypothetical protein [Candidatus Rokubacteria bacterium]
MPRGWAGGLLLMALLWAPAAAPAEMLLPPGFSAEVYVTGQGFDPDAGRAGRGIPATSTIAFDHAGVLFLARTARRYTGGEVEDLYPVYRVPAGGTRLTPGSEARYFHGPPLRNPQIAAVRNSRELFVSTFDRERRIGVLYRLSDGRATLFAGGTPPEGQAPLLRQPEAAAFDDGGHVYVADRQQDIVARLDASGHVLDARWLSVKRPRLLASGPGGQLWVGADGQAEAPWQRGPGEIWKVAPDGAASLVLRGPVAAGMAVSPGGRLFVADRHGSQLFILGPGGEQIEFARFTNGDFPRALAFAPITAETQRAGIAGSLFVVVIHRSAWPVNEVIRVSGPFEGFVRSR